MKSENSRINFRATYNDLAVDQSTAVDVLVNSAVERLTIQHTSL